jgi:hypothetical protein
MTSCEKLKVFGNPDKALVSTSHVERANLSMRMGMRRFTRLTDKCFQQKTGESHALGVVLLYGLQLRKNSQQHQNHASDGSRGNGDALEHGRYCDDDRHDGAIKNPLD